LIPYMTPGRSWLVAEAEFEVPALSSSPFSTCRYEEEVALRATAENEFVVLKKVRKGGATSVTSRHSPQAGQTTYPWALSTYPRAFPPLCPPSGCGLCLLT
jgi:hypothetical protein